MKKIFMFLALVPMITFAQERIMVIADPHVLAQSLVEKGEAFDAMMDNQRKMIDLSEQAWLALMDTAMKYKPSLLLIPGDLTKDSEKASHELVVNSLQQLRKEGINTFVIPGNHDIGGKAYGYKGSEKVEVENLKDEEWESMYSLVYEQVIAKDTESHSYAAEPLPGLTILGIDGSHNSAGTGSLSDNTLAWVLEQADKAVSKGNAIIAMTHWQLLEHFDMQGSLESACRLKNADAIRDSLMHHGIHALLTGHFHVNSISIYRDTTGVTNDSIVEISTGSPVTYPCPYRWLTLSKDRQDLSVETEEITSLASQPELLSYSREWMRVHTENMIPELTVRAWNKAIDYMDKNGDKMGSVFGPTAVSVIKSSLPADDATRIELTQKYFGSTVVDLYMVHSEANENENAKSDSLAQEVYKGMDGMLHELTDETLGKTIMGICMFCEVQNFLIATAKDAATGPVQSLTEDITLYGTPHADQTNDLRISLRISKPWSGETGMDAINGDASSTSKFIKDGQLFIRRNDQVFTIQGQKVTE